ncbi:hypothetical protein QR680_007718 [Steinernema hermaphroditum]|uniref:Uncharacterized protein n=1 Tax=Steinernema hermaphroditum TaxID=289476 RepID=A0AA39IE15_9BILA|nr:hypothetical protein QR680_007718 [Steinernema hermaphroditum]
MDMSEDLHCGEVICEKTFKQKPFDDASVDSEMPVLSYEANEERRVSKRFDLKFARHLFELIQSRDPTLMERWAIVSAMMEEVIVEVVHEYGLIEQLAASVVAMQKALSYQTMHKLKRRKYATEEERHEARLQRLQRYNEKRRIRRKIEREEKEKQKWCKYPRVV